MWGLLSLASITVLMIVMQNSGFNQRLIPGHMQKQNLCKLDSFAIVWQIGNLRKIAKLKICQHYFMHYHTMWKCSCIIAKFNIRQCILMTGLLNFMLTKVSCYTVVIL